jgi:hypothetical protein
MIGVVDIMFIALFGVAGYRLWTGTTSTAARSVSLGCVAYMLWVLVGP